MDKQRSLSKTEHKTVVLLSDGLGTKEIARAQNCSPATAHKRLANIYFKFGVSNAKQAITYAFRNGILTLSLLVFLMINSVFVSQARSFTRIRVNARITSVLRLKETHG